MSFKDELKDVWIKEKECLYKIDPKDQNELYKAQLNRVNEIEKRLTDMEKTEIEVEERAAGRDIEENLKIQQMEVDEKNQKSKNRIEIAKIAVPTTAAVVMGLIAMVYEKTDIMSSTTGKASWRDLIRFKI